MSHLKSSNVSHNSSDRSLKLLLVQPRNDRPIPTSAPISPTITTSVHISSHPTRPIILAERTRTWNHLGSPESCAGYLEQSTGFERLWTLIFIYFHNLLPRKMASQIQMADEVCRRRCSSHFAKREVMSNYFYTILSSIVQFPFFFYFRDSSLVSPLLSLFLLFFFEFFFFSIRSVRTRTIRRNVKRI